MTDESSQEKELNLRKRWTRGFLGGVTLGVYGIVTLVGPFLVGDLVHRLAAYFEMDNFWAWTLAMCVGIIWFLGFFGGGALIIQEDNKK